MRFVLALILLLIPTVTADACCGRLGRSRTVSVHRVAIRTHYRAGRRLGPSCAIVRGVAKAAVRVAPPYRGGCEGGRCRVRVH